MDGLKLGRVALSVCVGAIFVAGCSTSRPTTGVYGVVPQSRGIAADADNRAGQPPPPTAKNLYVANIGNDSITVYKPGTNSPDVLTISEGIKHPWSLAFDGSQKLYVANWSYSGTITVYPIGSSSLLRTITNKVGTPAAIAFDASDSDFYDVSYPPYDGYAPYSPNYICGRG